MADYGHDLVFGTFITPSSRQPHDVVALAQITEQAGLDLATFQDHPYQPAFLDTWTLLSWVAAETKTLRVSGNVLNLPLRPPVVLARAAASLDMLSGGRYEMAIGAGAFWDAIEAVGGPRRTPKEAVQALSEVIDDAAAAAGRDPCQIRRLVNIHGSFSPDSHSFLQGAPDQWVEELLPFVLEHGVSTFILATDDPHAIQRWGGEVAPALRETVERERQEACTRSGESAGRP